MAEFAKFRAATLAVGLLVLLACAAATAGEATVGESKRPFWVYHAGKFYWAGDYSSNATADYRDKSGAPVDGARDIKVVVQGKWGLFQPFATNWDFDTSPYTYFTFSLKPTAPSQVLQVYFMLVGDKPVGKAIDPFQYGPQPEVGKWSTYRIPLQDIGVAGIHVYKFAIQDQTGRATNTFYLDEIGFLGAGP